MKKLTYLLLVVITAALLALSFVACTETDPQPAVDCPCPWFDGKAQYCSCFEPEDFNG